ncbi:MAG: hypothetical protein R8M11_05915 [Gallionella sp.]
MLITIFLVIQWTPSHAHLNTQHDHGGEFHQHLADTHAHLPVFAHLESIDAEHIQEDVTSVVELDHDQIILNAKSISDSSSILAVSVRALLKTPIRTTHFLENSNALRKSPPPHIGEPRAPPQRFQLLSQ